MTKLLASLTLTAAIAVATLTTNPRSAFALDGPSLSDGSDGSGSTVCGAGTTVECGSTTVTKCTQWVYQLSWGPGGFSYTPICAATIIQTSKSYKD